MIECRVVTVSQLLSFFVGQFKPEETRDTRGTHTDTRTMTDLFGLIKSASGLWPGLGLVDFAGRE